MSACLFDILFMLPLCLIGTSLSTLYLQGPEQTAWMYVISVLSLGIFVVLKHWKSRLKFLVPVIPAVAVAAVILLRAPKERVDFIISNLWVLFLILIGFASFLGGWLLSEIRIARRISLFYGAVLLILNMVLWKSAPKETVGFAFFLMLLIAADEVQHYWKKSGDTDAKKHIVFISPFLLLTGILILIIPAPEKPVDYSAVIRLAQRTVAYVKTNTVRFHRGEENFDAYIGFSDDGSFKGGLKGNAKEVMRLTTEANTDPVIYLNGKVMDTFNGRSWSEEYTEANNDRVMDTLELLSAINEYGDGEESDYIRSTKITLQYMNFYSGYCFAPYKPIPGEQRINGVSYSQQGGDYIAKDELGYGSTYSAFSYRMNRGHEKFAGLLSGEAANIGEGAEFKKSWEETVQKYLPGKEIPYEEYLAYRKKIYDVYLPETILSEKSTDYLDEVMEWSESDYECLCRIQDLLSGMQYSGTPGVLPDEVNSPADFLDYFLFEKQEGYCTFYATAFVLMARSRGIPARMVQGFRVDAKGGQTVSVRSDMAHSWAEAYIDGVGWMIFDPTPGGMQDSYWRSAEERAQYQPPEIKKDDVPVVPGGQGEVPGDDQGEKKGNGINVKMVLIPLSAVILVLILYFICYRMTGIMRYRKKSTEEKFFLTCKKNLRILKNLGYCMEQGETIEEFATRIAKKSDPSSIAFLKDYERVCYAEVQVSEKALNLAEQNMTVLLSRLKEVKGRKLVWLYFRMGV